MTQRIEVYGPAWGPAYCVLVLLEELGLDYTHTSTPPAQSFGPGGRPPILVAGGQRFYDTVGSCLYLSDTCPGLAPSPDSPERQAYGQWCLAVAGLFGLLASGSLGPDHPALGRVLASAAQLTQKLQTRPFLVGQRYTTADLLTASGLAWLVRLGLLQPQGALAAYLERVLSRPAFARAVQGCALSLAVLTGPAYETHLPLCLEMLARQSFHAFEVQVLDQGSDTGAEACRAFARRLSLQHVALPASLTTAACFNRALAASRHRWLVCLNASTLLNPEALASYAHYLAAPGAGLIFGYLGTGVDRTEAGPDQAHAPSRWFPGCQVAYLDYRIRLYKPDFLVSPGLLHQHPYWYASGSNFALSRELAALPWDESLGDWRLACVDLAHRALAAGQRIDFLVDAWAEQVIHPEAAAPERPGRRFALLTAREPARLLFSQTGRDTLLAALFSHYLPADPRHGPAQGEAQVLTLADQYAISGIHRLTAKPADARPDFLIIGAARAGTTSLHNALALHPRLSAALSTHIDFFSHDETFARGLDWYLDHFFFAPGKLCFETSADYLPSPEAPARIAAFHPGIRLIAVLREPMSRAFSEWRNRHREGDDPRSFEAAIAAALAGDPDTHYLERGKYAEQLQRYLARFPRSRLLLLDYAELLQDHNRALQKCCTFLGIDPLELDPRQMPRLPAGAPTPMPAALQQELQAYYRPHNRRLRDELGLDYAWLD